MKAVLFDLDGTVIDSAKDIELCLKKTLRDIGMEDRMPENVRSLIGGGVKALLEKVLKEDFKEEYVEIFRKHYLENPVVHTKLYDGIEEVLKELKKRGIKLAVVSNKLEELSKKILEILKVHEYFDFIAGGDTFKEKKPSPVPVIKTLEVLNVKPEDALVVGDTSADIEAGLKAGTKTALASWGYVRLDSVKPDYILKRPEDLLNLT